MKKEDITIPVSSGELIDKISILKIKRKKIINKSKLQNINHELSLLNKMTSPNLLPHNGFLLQLSTNNSNLTDLYNKQCKKHESAQ